MKIFVVVPAYNEEGRIGSFLKSVLKKTNNIIVVDDGSKDNTVKEAHLKGIILIKHKINLGKGAAMKTGAEVAFRLGADGVVFMDSDGQHFAGDLSKFINKLNQGFEVVFGKREMSKNMPMIRKLGNLFGQRLVEFLFKIKVDDLLCGFRGLTKRGYRKIVWESLGYGVETEMVAKVGIKGLKYCEVPIKTIYHDRVKGVTILDAIGLFFDVIRWRFIK